MTMGNRAYISITTKIKALSSRSRESGSKSRKITRFLCDITPLHVRKILLVARLSTCSTLESKVTPAGDETWVAQHRCVLTKKRGKSNQGTSKSRTLLVFALILWMFESQESVLVMMTPRSFCSEARIRAVPSRV